MEMTISVWKMFHGWIMVGVKSPTESVEVDEILTLKPGSES